MDENLVLPVIFALVVLASVVTVAYFVETENGKLYQTIIDRRNTDVDNLANIMGDRINNTYDIISSASGLPSMTSPPDVRLVNRTLHGISSLDDLPKRIVAKNILQNVKDIESVRFLLPNGDMYMMEPYQYQLDLKQDNFAMMDYYKQVVSRQVPYLSGVFQSKSTGHNTTVISAPVFSSDKALVGILAGAIKLQFINDYVSTHYLGKTALVAILDQNGNVVTSTNRAILHNTALNGLDVFSSALGGRSGSKIETLENTMMLVSFHPIRTPSSVWVMMSITPYDEAFASYKTTQNEMYLMIAGMVTFVTIFGLYVRKTFYSSKKLIRELERSQSKLQEQYEDVVNLGRKVSASEEKYRNLYEKSPDLLRSIDLNGVITDCNESYAKSLGYLRDEAIGMSILDHTAENSLTEMSSQFKEWQTSGNILNKEIWMKRRDGTTFPALLNGTNIYDSDGNVVGRTVSLRDMTEIYNIRKTLESNNQRLQEQHHEMKNLVEKLEEINGKLQREKEQSSKLAIIGERMSQINHNLRNPLNVIMWSAELLNKASIESKNDKAAAKSQSIMNAANSMLHQIDDLMNFIRDTTLHMKTVSLNQIFTSAISVIKKPQSVQIHLPVQDLICRCDPEKLQAVLMNLFTNAIEAMENSGTITVRAGQTESEVIIEVEDTGPGIPYDVLPKIFETLFTTKKSGTGLGLPYCKRVIEQHGGMISASTKPTVFTIVLPK